MDRFVTIARILKTRGIKGEVLAEILTDFPERFSSVRQVHLLCRNHQYWEELEQHWFYRDKIVLKFRNRNSPESVQELVGCEVQIPEEDRVELPEGTYYDSDLVGCQVFEKGESLGKVVQIMKRGVAVPNLVVSGPAGKELIVPMVDEFIRRIDVAKKIIEVKLPHGLKEL